MKNFGNFKRLLPKLLVNNPGAVLVSNFLHHVLGRFPSLYWNRLSLIPSAERFKIRFTFCCLFVIRFFRYPAILSKIIRYSGLKFSSAHPFFPFRSTQNTVGVTHQETEETMLGLARYTRPEEGCFRGSELYQCSDVLPHRPSRRTLGVSGMNWVSQTRGGWES